MIVPSYIEDIWDSQKIAFIKIYKVMTFTTGT